MTRATINRTGRRAIPHNKVLLHLREESDQIRVTGTVNLASFPADLGGRVVLELYRRGDRYREEVGPIHPSVEVDKTFERFASVQAVSCDVLLVGEGAQANLILAAARGVRPKADFTEGETKSLLRVAPEDLGQTLWALSLDEEGVTLGVN